MDEQKESEDKVRMHVKKRRLIGRIAGWVWAVLLIILLIAAVILQVPLKVITLIAIFLAAATILPKRFRKWFWAGVGTAVLVLAIWIIWPSDYEGWEQYRYDFTQELGKLEQERAIPPAENASVDYQMLMKEYDADADTIDSFNAVFKKPWKTTDYPDAAMYLEKHASTIEALIEISKIPECRFPLENPSEDYNITHQRVVRHWAYLLTISANNDAGEGKTAEAIEKYTAVSRIGDHIMQQGTALDILISIAIKAMGYTRVRPLLLRDANEEQITLIETTICSPENNWEVAWQQMLKYDKLAASSSLALYYEVNRKGEIRRSPDPYRPLRMLLQERIGKTWSDTNQTDVNDELCKMEEAVVKRVYRVAYPSWLQLKLAKTWAIVAWLYLPSRPEDARDLFCNWLDSPNYAIGEIGESRRSHAWLASLGQGPMISSLARTYKQTRGRMLELRSRLEADRKGTLLIAALARFKNANGKWPDKLEELKNFASAEAFVDPMNGGTFVYKLNNDEFTLYSKGANGIDDGGKRERISFTKGRETLNMGSDDWIIWPTGKCEDPQEDDNG